MGLSLPVTLEIEEFSYYEERESTLDRETAEALLSGYALDMTEKQMQAGEILHHSHVLHEEESLFWLETTMECHEMIAQVAEAKWNNEDFVND